MKIFGVNIQLSKQTKPSGNNAAKQSNSKKRATVAIKKQPRREISFEIKDITAAINLANNVDSPDRNRLFQIYRYIKRDGHLKSQIKTAKIKVASEPWLLYKNGQPDIKATELFNKTWLNKLIEYILEQEFEGFSLVELDDIDAANINATVTLIPREHVSIEKQWILIEASINGAYLPYADIMQEIDLLEFTGARDDLGSLLECSYNIIWKYYSRSDWSRTSEKVGMPIVQIGADTNDDKELDAIEARAANLGTDGYMVTQKDDTVQLLERKSDRIHDIYWDNVKLCNEEVSKIINGNTATTDQKAFVGSSEVQERTMDDFTQARLQMIVNNMNDVVIPYLKYKGFPIDHTFDYPLLKRNRERRITGAPLPTDPKPATEQPPQPEQKPTKKGNK